MISASEVTNLIKATAYPLVKDDYEREPAIRDLVCDMLPWDDRFAYGERMDHIGDFGEPDVIEFGQEPGDRNNYDGWPRLFKGRKLAHKATFARELLDASDAQGRIRGWVTDQFSGVGGRFSQQQEKWCAAMFEQGVLTAGNLKYYDQSFPNEVDPYPSVSYDGLPFFDTAHTLKQSATTPSNHTASAALSQSTIEAGLTLMQVTSAVDDRNEPVVNMMDSLLIPGGALEFTASVILESALKPGSANNDVNTVGGINRTLRPIAWRYLTDASAWYLLRTTPGKRPFRMRSSGPPRIEVVEDRLKQLIHVTAVTYFSCGPHEWRSAGCFNRAAA